MGNAAACMFDCNSCCIQTSARSVDTRDGVFRRIGKAFDFPEHDHRQQIRIRTMRVPERRFDFVVASSIPMHIQRYEKERRTAYRKDWKKTFNYVFGSTFPPQKARMVVMPGRDIAHHILNSCSAYGLRATPNSATLTLDLSVFDAVSYYPTHFCEARGAVVDPSTGALRSITMKDGSVVRPGTPTWSTAKQYLCGAISHWEAMYGHNWVHFHFNAVMCHAIYTLCSTTDNLVFQMMEPHVRYNIETNAEGMYSTIPSSDINLFQDDVAQWFTQHHIDVGTFQNTVADRTLAFWTHTPGKYSAESKHVFVRAGFPHRGFDHDSKIPYLANLRALYTPIRAFVCTVFEAMPASDQELVHEVLYTLRRHLPAHMFANREQKGDAWPGCALACDVFATFIWQSMCIHSIDHYTIHTFASTHGCPLNFRKQWTPTTTELKEGEHFTDKDVLKMHAFQDLVVRYKPNLTDKGNPAPDDGSLHTLRYTFSESMPALQHAAERMKTTLAALLADKFQICDTKIIATSVAF